MKRILLFLAVATLMAAMVMASALPAFAVHPDEPCSPTSPTNPCPHQHFIDTDDTDASNELREIGPESCPPEDETTGTPTAFDNVHFNVHRGVPGQDADDTSEQTGGEDQNPVNIGPGSCQVEGR